MLLSRKKFTQAANGHGKQIRSITVSIKQLLHKWKKLHLKLTKLIRNHTVISFSNFVEKFDFVHHNKITRSNFLRLIITIYLQFYTNNKTILYTLVQTFSALTIRPVRRYRHLVKLIISQPLLV